RRRPEYPFHRRSIGAGQVKPLTGAPMRRAAAVSFLTVAVLASSATASFAGLPSVKNPVIKVPGSIAGVKLGMAQDEATKKWGNSGKCVKTGAQNAYTNCEYRKARNPGLGRAIFGIVPG